MSRIKRLIPAFSLFILLIVSDFTFLHFYHLDVYEDNKTCLERRNGDLCNDVKSAGDAAFSAATSGHLLTYFVIFLTFVMLDSRAGKTEKRVAELESRINV